MNRAVFILLMIFVFSCGPASEDRAKMHSDAKHIKDSMEKHLKQRLEEAEGPWSPPLAPATSNAK
jgi:hypothetical protein